MKKRSKWRKRVLRRLAMRVILTGWGMTLVLAGCGKSSTLQSGQYGRAAVAPVIAINQADNRADEAQPYSFPLTGKPSPAEVKSRPIMVMVENSTQARPQSGLDKADLVYEILAEGEITRFVVVYQSESPAVIGPVRSIRPYFVQVGEGLDAVMVHAGWSQEAMDMIAQRKLSHFDQVYGDSKYYWRTDDRKMPHNLYTSLDKIRQGMEDKQIRQVWNDGHALTFSTKTPAVPGQALTKITIPYLLGYNVSYQYDAASGRFLRSMEGKPHMDRETGRQLAADNVLIAEAKHRVVDNEGRREVDVYGPGKGYLLQKGAMRSITWERKDGIIRAYAGGQELALLPGKTWVQVVPEGTKLSWE